MPPGPVRIRQALLTFTAADIQLVAFTNPDAIRRYHSFRLLHECGRQSCGHPVSYAVPRTTEANLFSLDARLFTNGWIHVLEDSELAFLIMMADLQARAANEDPVAVPGDVRIGHYCLGTDGYQAHHLLERAGLIRMVRARGRRRDGTFRGYDPDYGSGGVPHHFRILSNGFAPDCTTYDGPHTPPAMSRRPGRRRKMDQRGV
jgi:hypothetical protein